MEKDIKELRKNLIEIVEDALWMSRRDAIDLLALLFTEMREYNNEVVSDVICNFHGNDY